MELGQDLKVGWGQVGGSRKEGKELAHVRESREERKGEVSPSLSFHLFCTCYLPFHRENSVEEKPRNLVSKPCNSSSVHRVQEATFSTSAPRKLGI